MEAVKAVGGAFQQHVVAPLVTIRNDLFATLRTRPSIVSTQASRLSRPSTSHLRLMAAEAVVWSGQRKAAQWLARNSPALS